MNVHRPDRSYCALCWGRHIARAWGDMDAASPSQAVVVLLLLLALFVAAGVEWT